MDRVDQRQYPRLGLGLPVTLLFSDPEQKVAGELQDLSLGGCFFKSSRQLDMNTRISVMFSDNTGKTFEASGRVVRTMAYRGFAVLFVSSAEGINDIIRDISQLTQEERARFLGAVLKPEIRIY
jgi:PilZ domain